MFRIIINTLFILFIATVVFCESQQWQQHNHHRRPQRHNVVLILADDLRPAIGKYGDPIAITPNLDRFTSHSSYFTRAYSQQALCAPSRNSMLTGRRPDTLHLYDFYNYWREFTGNFTTLPQYFKANGYTTYSIGKVFHPGISSNYSDDYPYSWSSPAFHPRTEAFMNSPVCPDGSGKLKANVVCPVNIFSQPGKTLPDIESLEEAQRFLQTHKNDADPFFLAVGFHKPHLPFRFPEKYLKLHPRYKFNNSSDMRGSGIPDVAWNPYNDIRRRDDATSWKIPFPYGPVPVEFAILMKQAYYASVSYIDNLFGQLLSKIDLENTIVVLTSDHGWSLGEHGEWAKYSNFEVAVRVPLVIHTPGMQPKRIDDVVELLDIFPTLVDLAGLEKVPECADRQSEIFCIEGKSLLGILNGFRSNWPNQALSQYPRPGIEPTKSPDSDRPRLRQIRIMGYSIRTEDFRYTLWVKFNHLNFSKNWHRIYGEELYDHRLDPTESMNLIDRPELSNVRFQLRSMVKQRFS